MEIDDDFLGGGWKVCVRDREGRSIAEHIFTGCDNGVVYEVIEDAEVIGIFGRVSLLC